MAPGPSSARARVGRALLLLATLGHIGAYLYAAPEHVVDPGWPPHARFHVLQAIFWVVGFNLVLVPLIMGPLARGETWVRGVLLLAWPFVHGAYFVALLRGGGPPEASAHAGLLALLLLYGAGLALVWRPAGSDRRAPAQPPA